MKASQILTAAKAVISDPVNWIQHSSAKDIKGITVSAISPKAVCFCTIGAMSKTAYELNVSEDLAFRYLFKAVARIESKIAFVYLFNDTHTHEDVMKMFNTAIDLAKIDELYNELKS